MQEQQNNSSDQNQSLHSLRIPNNQKNESQNISSKKYSQNKKKQSNHQEIQQQSFQQAENEEQQIEDQQIEQQGMNFQSLNNLNSTQLLKKKIMQQKKSEISNFIIKTYRILEDPINSNIVQWTDEGNAFIVKNKQLFENQILPKYFKHKKFSSFVRQLNMYDFHKIRKQKQIPIFKHKYFREGCIELLCKIKRKSGDEPGMGGNQEDDNAPQINNAITKNYIPSLADLAEKPLLSAYSLKSKPHLPYASMLNSQPSIGLLPGSGTADTSELDQLLQQNQELTSAISDLTHQQITLQMQRQRRKQKVTKILNVLLNFELNDANGEQIYRQLNIQSFDYDAKFSLRDLQNHYSSEEDPFSFSEYTVFLRRVYQNLKRNLKRMNGQTEQPVQQRKIQEEERK